MSLFGQTSRKHLKCHWNELKDVDHDNQLHTDKQLEEKHREQTLFGKHEERDLDQMVPDIVSSKTF